MKKINVEKILKLWENYCFIFNFNHILKFKNFRVWQWCSLGVCGDTLKELVNRAFSMGEQINSNIRPGASGVCWAHPTEHLLWVHFSGYVDTWELFGSLYLYGCQRRTIMVDASLTKMLALASKERAIGFGDKTMLSMHTTYLLCGWIWSQASKCGTKPVGE